MTRRFSFPTLPAPRPAPGTQPGTIVVTGAAGGFGRAIAETFAAAGWHVGAFGIRTDKFAEWAPAYPTITTGQLDVTDADQWQTVLADFAAAHDGSIDVLVNNAGVLYAGDFITQGSYEADSRTVDVNLTGVLFGCRAAFPYLAAADGAHLINVCSAAAFYGTPDMAVYSATKYAVRGITEALEVEWAGHGIQVSDVMPLYSNTALIENHRTVGMKRLGTTTTPQDVADEIFAVVARGRRTPAKVHHPVGAKAALLFGSTHFSPGFLTRYINGLLTYQGKVRF
ncbi:SDR family oxidoreductase [Corynebacterium uterequi]|uniref:Short-chain alcohol dehydrogenase n=1 Tax=Corynebacterium uterequi TaxID=1072256 RepID=A0A0G3HFY9_9CORY|nr:SDR family oxidoreductase [Corynebacterium uterequi]AKK10077.1 short-chain alcohol dehydrogenase [Corynebacterium uterequi]